MKFPLFKSPRNILLSHVERLKRVVTLKKSTDRQNAALFESELYDLARKHKYLSHLRIAVFILVYASVLSTIAVQLPVFGYVARTITAVAGLVGIGLLSLVLLLITFRMRQLWDRMILVYTHVVAIYEKNNTGLYSAAELARNDEAEKTK
jgi:hypothetical protein